MKKLKSNKHRLNEKQLRRRTIQKLDEAIFALKAVRKNLEVLQNNPSLVRKTKDKRK